jgi:hypothetical protein
MPPEATQTSALITKDEEETNNPPVPLTDNCGATESSALINTTTGLVEEHSNDDDQVEYVDIDPSALSFEDQASCLSSWFLFYLTPLLKLGATKILDSKDVGPPSKIDRAKS